MNDHVRRTIEQWKIKASGDWTTVQILQGSPLCPADSVCFHCQQYVEKLLKAALTANGVETPRTHDLRRLVQLAKPFIPALGELADVSDTLTVHGVETRYPGDCRQVGSEEMREVIAIAEKFGRILLPELN